MPLFLSWSNFGPLYKAKDISRPGIDTFLRFGNIKRLDLNAGQVLPQILKPYALTLDNSHSKTWKKLFKNCGAIMWLRNILMKFVIYSKSMRIKLLIKGSSLVSWDLQKDLCSTRRKNMDMVCSKIHEERLNLIKETFHEFLPGNFQNL